MSADEILSAEKCLGTAKRWEAIAKHDLERAKKNLEVAEKEVKEAEALLSSMQRKWAAGAYLLLHPNIYGQGEFTTRIFQVAEALGLTSDTAKKWYGLNDQNWKKFAEKWMPIVKSTKWKDVSTFFTKKWYDQWPVAEEELISEEQISLWAKSVKGLKRKRGVAVAQKATTTNRTNSKRRKDVGTSRKYLEQEAFVKQLVAQRWNVGDPIGRKELYSAVKARHDCDVGTDFFNSYVDPQKSSAASGFANWVRRALERDGWSLKGKEIVKAIPEPEEWEELAEINE